jgi:hypothetical protein
VYVGGRFKIAGGLPASNVAKWDGQSWSALGSGIEVGQGLVVVLGVFDDGSGPALYAGGWFTAAGGVPADNIAKWDGKGWSPVGGGIAGKDALVFALATHDDGGGPALYVGGRFNSAGGTPAANIARWNGQSWSPVGSGVGGGWQPTVAALAVWDDGRGSALYVGGGFKFAGGITASNIAKWDGQGWSALGSGVDGPVYALADIGEHRNRVLYVGGDFGTAGGVAASDLAGWDGAAWSVVAPAGTNGDINAMVMQHDGHEVTAHVGGMFTRTGGQPSAFVGECRCAGLLGDLNCDALVDELDIEPFVLALVDSAAYATSYPNCDLRNADCNVDGAVDAFDIDPFVDLLTDP